MLPKSGFASWLPWRSYCFCAPRRAWGCDFLTCQHFPRVERLDMSWCPRLRFRHIDSARPPLPAYHFFVMQSLCWNGDDYFKLKSTMSISRYDSNTRTRILQGRAMISRLQIENDHALYNNKSVFVMPSSSRGAPCLAIRLCLRFGCCVLRRDNVRTEICIMNAK